MPAKAGIFENSLRLLTGVLNEKVARSDVGRCARIHTPYIEAEVDDADKLAESLAIDAAVTAFVRNISADLVDRVICPITSKGGVEVAAELRSHFDLTVHHPVTEVS